jgi:sugar diacid utilization regulator
MEDASGWPQLDEVLTGMMNDRQVVDEVIAAARAASPEVARLPEEENRRHIEVLVAEGLRSFGGKSADSMQHVFAAALGADRAAQGVPINALLRAVHAGRTRVLQLAVERGRACGVPDATVVEALLLDATEYVADTERHIIGGYHAAEQELARSALDVRTRLVQKLLGSERNSAVTQPELDRVGLNADGRYHCLLSNVTEPAQARVLEHDLDGSGGVFGLVDGHLAGVVSRLPSHDTVERGILLIAGPAVAIPDLSASHRLCAATMRTVATTGRQGLYRVSDLAVETALAAQPELGALLRETLLGALDPTETFHRQLAATAIAYLDHQLRLDRTAAALHVHPNTVRYRLTRLREITGIRLDVPFSETALTLPQLQQNWWALHTWQTEAARLRP